MRVIVALGGNALLRAGQPMTGEAQLGNVAAACRQLASIAQRGNLIISHGNGPQSGYLADLEGDAWGLDVIDAETQGMIGYAIEQELERNLPASGPKVVALLTRVLVDRGDPAFKRPTKPIGPWLLERPARGEFLHDEKRGFRALVPSPTPRHVIEAPAIDALLKAGLVVVAAGGGGIPVVQTDRGHHIGIAAVVDKDRTSALLGRQLNCTSLVIATDVQGVMRDFGTPSQQLIREISLDAVPSWISDLPEGSMRPKVEAAIEFVRGRGAGVFAAIGSIDELEGLMNGTHGTRVVDTSGKSKLSKL